MKVLKNLSTIVIALLIVLSSVFLAGTKSEAKTKKITMYVDQEVTLTYYFGLGERFESVAKNKLVELTDSRQALKAKKKGKGIVKLYTSSGSKKSVHKLKLNIKKNPLKYELQDLPYHLLRENKQATFKFTNTSNKFISAKYKFKFYDSDGASKGDANIDTGVIFPKQTAYVDFGSY